MSIDRQTIRDWWAPAATLVAIVAGYGALRAEVVSLRRDVARLDAYIQAMVVGGRNLPNLGQAAKIRLDTGAAAVDNGLVMANKQQAFRKLAVPDIRRWMWWRGVLAKYPGGLMEQSEAARVLGISRQTVNRYTVIGTPPDMPEWVTVQFNGDRPARQYVAAAVVLQTLEQCHGGPYLNTLDSEHLAEIALSDVLARHSKTRRYTDPPA